MWVRIPPGAPIPSSVRPKAQSVATLLSFVKRHVKVHKNGCWEWLLSFSSNGYPQKLVNGRIRTVHRALAEELELVGPNEIVRHLCNWSACCNPKHFMSGSHKDNWHDSEREHRRANKKLRKKWQISGKKYRTCREAQRETGLTFSSLSKYTKDGIFDIKAYRKACRIANVRPKV